MNKFSENDLKKITYESIYKRGSLYYKEGRIKKFKVEKIQQGFFDKYDLVEGNVKGSSDLYNVRTTVGNGILENYSCDCQYCNTTGNICKHIVALLIKYIKEKDEYYNAEETISTRFINNLKNNLFSCEIDNKDKRLILVDVDINVYEGNMAYDYDYYYDYDDDDDDYEDNVFFYEISFRMGENRKYVVKNLGKLLEAIIYNKELYFGKEFTFNPKIHTFNEIDQKLIDFLMDIYLANSAVRRSSHSYTLNSKEVKLNKFQFIKLLDILKEREFSGTILYNQCNNIKVKEEKLPIDFKISSCKSGVSIKFGNNMPQLIGNNLFYLSGTIYIPPEKQSQLYLNFCDMLKSNKEKIIIKEKNYDILGSCIIPAIKSISDDIDVSPSVRKLFYNINLRTDLYFDKIGNDLSCKVLFNYGDISVSPLLNELSYTINEEILVRNIDEEIEILGILNKHKFQPSKDCYILSGESQEDILEFISSGLTELQNKCEVYCTDSFKNIKIYNSSKINSSVRINGEDLLEFSFDIEGVDKEELLDVYKSLKLKKSYHKLKNGSFIMLNSSEFEEFMDTVSYLGLNSKEISKDIITLPKYNSIYLDEKLKSKGNFNVEKNKKFRETIASMKDMNESDFAVPENLGKTLRAYQKTGFKWFSTLSYCGFGGILADEMGLGKTLQAISFMCSLKNNNVVGPILVICPTSLVYNWESEINKFASDLKVLVISGTKSCRQEALNLLQEYDVVVTSYPLLRIDIDLYKKIHFACTFIDEAQNIKNANSISAKSVKMINSKYRFALTGTPIENNLSELWSIFDFIMPGYLLSEGNFRKLYEMPIVKNKDENALVELNRHINPFILRRYKNDVIKELPPKIEHKFLIDLNEAQKKVYASYMKMYKDEVDREISENGLGKSKIKILSLLTRLRQICCDPSSFIENYKGNSAKIDALLEIVKDNLDEKHRILIFSQFTSILKNIKDKLIEMGIDIFYLDGSTASESRIEMVNDFNEGRKDVFLISLKAGGTGLNLTGADTVIHFDPWWNPAVEDQATDRAHRIGQKKTVEVIKLIAKGTIEEKINSLQEKKKDIFNSVVNNVSNENILTSMDEKQIMDLFI